MRRSSVVGLLFVGVVVSTSADVSAQVWGRPQTPSSGVCFYEDIDFGGRYFCVRAGMSTAQVPPATNDMISSIQIFGDAELTVFRDADYRGSSRRFVDNISDLRRSGWNDRISSYRIGTRSYGGGAYGGGGAWSGDNDWGGASGQSGVCFFEDANFRGDRFCADAGTSTAQVPRGSNDRISSIRVYGNAQVTASGDADFRGPSRRFDADASNLDPLGWNDLISSFRVGTRSAGGGSWGGGGWGGSGWGRDDSLQVFSDISFRGQSAMLNANTPDVAASGMGGLISSLRVPAGQSWQVCTEPNYRGRCQTVSGTVSDLQPGNWNDVIASARRIR